MYRNVPNCDYNVVLYMFLPTDIRNLVLAGIPELLLWNNLYSCVYLLLCASLRLLHLKMIEFYLLYSYSVHILCFST